MLKSEEKIGKQRVEEKEEKIRKKRIFKYVCLFVQQAIFLSINKKSLIFEHSFRNI